MVGGARVEPPVRLARGEGPLGVNSPEGGPCVTKQNNILTLTNISNDSQEKYLFFLNR